MLSFPASLVAQPDKLFGEDGAMIWVQSDVRDLGFYTLNGGSNLDVFFSASRAEDSRRLVYHQVFNLDGSHRFETPELISPPDMVASFGAGARDESGNFFLGYFAAPPNDLTDVHLYVQKYDDQGRALWEDGLVERMVIDTGAGGDLGANDTPGSELVFPDGRGGCYFVSNFGIFALGAEGNLREYEHQRQRPANLGIEYNYASSDGIGGFWIDQYDSEISDYLWNHISYEGNLLWDEFRTMYTDSLEGSPRLRFLKGYHGGAICTFEGSNNSVGICRINEIGEFAGQEYVTLLEEDWRIYSNFCPTDDDGFTIILGNSYRDNENDLDIDNYRVTKYLPDDNTFPWGIQGTELYSFQSPQEEHTYYSVYFQPILLPNGDQLFSMEDNYQGDSIEVEFVRISPEGETLFRINQSIKSDPNDYGWSGGMIPDSENGLWFYGSSNEASVVTRFSADLDYLFEDFLPTTLPGRPSLRTPMLWLDENSNHKLLSLFPDGFRHIAVTPQGEVTTPPDGELVLPFEWKYNGAVRSAKRGNQIFCLWKTQVDTRAKVVSFDLQGNHLWTTEIEVENYFHHTQYELTVLPEENAILVGTIDIEDQIFTPYLFKIDGASGQVIWTRNQPSVEFGDRWFNGPIYRYTVVNDGAIFDGFGLAGDVFKITKIDYDGVQASQRIVRIPLDSGVVAFGMAPTDTGGVFVGLYVDNEDSTMAWIQEVKRGCSFGASHLAFQHYLHNLSHPNRDYPMFTLTKSRGNLWIRGVEDYQDSLVVVQGMRTNGEFFWNDGFWPPDRNGRRARITGGIGDGAGGYWLLYNYPEGLGYYGAPLVQWLPSDGSDPEEGVYLSDNPVLAELNFYYIMRNGDLVTV